MTIRAVTFDLDDTLWPVAPVIEHAERVMHAWLAQHCPEVAAQHQIEDLRAIRVKIAEDHPHLIHDFSALRRLSLERALHPHGYDGEHVESAFQIFYRARQQVKLFDDALPVLESLSARYRLGSISNGNADLALIGLDRFFSARVHARQLGHAKPSPEIFLATCQQLGCRPDEVLHVGDDPELDVDGARSAGMPVVWLNRAGRGWPGSGVAPVSIRALSELLRRLESDPTL